MHSVRTDRLYCPGPVLALGIIQVILAILVIVHDLTAMFALVGFELIDINAAYTGLVISVLLIVAGSFGIAAGVPLPPNKPTISRRCFLATALGFSVFIMVGAGVIVLFYILLLTTNLETIRHNMVYECPDAWYDASTPTSVYIQCMNRFMRVYDIGWIIAPLSMGIQVLVAVICLAQTIVISVNLRKLALKVTSMPQGIPPVNYAAYPVVYSQGANGQQITFSQPPIAKETDV